MTRQRRRRIVHARRTGTGLALVAAISFLAGMTDAVGLVITGDFVSFMTGNTTRAAIAFVRNDLAHALTLLLAILLFVAGNALGVVAAHLSPRRVFTVLACVSLLIGAASLVDTASLPVLQFGLVVLSMGMVNATVEHIEGLPIGLTYVTGALSRFGRGIGRFLLGERRFDWTIQLIPWLGMVSGAIAGAMIAQWLQPQALKIVAGFAMTLALATLIVPHHLQRRFGHRAAR